MRLSKMKANDFTSTYKVTIQKSGKLGFTKFTASQLNIDNSTYVNFFKDEDAPKSPILVFTKEKSAEAFVAHLSGEYYSLSTTVLFTSLGFDFKKDKVMCELKRTPEADEFVNGEAYRLIVRPEKKKKTPEPDDAPF